MSFLRPKINIPPPPPAPEPPEEPDYERAAAMATENERNERSRRKGRGSTIVAGGLTAGQKKDENKTLLG
tara:strand:- start:440 stop:649 length:210 start_codon:yes stop_codon:yes gene_type:complete